MKLEIKEFFSKVEGYIENDKCHLFFTTTKDSYDFTIIKTDSDYMDYFCEQLNISKKKYSKKPFYYENGYNNIENYINYALLFGSIGLIIKVPLFKKWNSEGKNLLKVYGFHLFLKDDKLVINQTSAEELVEAYSLDYKTREKINPPKDYIYCGGDNDDVICGFDLD